MHTTARPVGPRAISSQNHPPHPSISPTPPLNIRKQPQRPTLAVPASSSSPRSKSPTPSLSLAIPGASSRPNTPKPNIRVAIPAINTGSTPNQQNPDPDDAQGGYYSGPFGSAVKLNSSDHDELTIRPDSAPAARPEPLLSIRTLLTSLESKSQSAARSQPGSDAEDDNADAVLAESAAATQQLPWSDDVLEEISRLGEGAGGAVHKVKDKRTGKIMARKTITTREAPMKQLLRELSIISSTEHINIILFHGAYMSPSSSEVKILMEFCEGGSLEAIGKKIKERNAIVERHDATYRSEVPTRYPRRAEAILLESAPDLIHLTYAHPQVLQGLAYLHTKRTIHRDIKPSNILLSRAGVAGTFTGTSFYMAPERICGAKYTIRSDVWSTGISLLELVQNRFPFPSDLPPIELMMYITQGEPPRLEDEPGVQWSDEMKDFIKQTLTVDALTRPTPKDMLAHPWVVNAMRQEVHMARWIRKVWEWPKTSRRSRDK
ncbi:STE/STE7 protein kinase [Mycena galericulata]|nr:STE/STE7 protein kinase [Mycena galericulata]